MDYFEVERYISDIPKFTVKHTLEHTKRFLRELGNPQEKMKVIHVAGTNGKGSVCAMISEILLECDKSVGLFTSPHLVEITERVRINGKDVSRDVFVKSFDKVKAISDRLEKEGYTHPSYFEFLFLMAMDIFKYYKLKYVVLETGLGGRLDATNSVENPILAVITSIGLDHMEILGDTIEKIAIEKAGIIKSGLSVVYQANNSEVCNIIEKKAIECGAKTYPCRKKDYKIIKKTNNHIDFCLLCGYYLSYVYSIPFISEYQVENAVLAINAISQIEDIRNQTDKIKAALMKVKWQGRMELVRDGVYFDGAHNGPGIDAFTDTVIKYECKGRKLLLFSAVKEKEYGYMIQQICHRIRPDKVYVTQLESDRGALAGDIAKEFDGTPVCIANNSEECLKMALAEKKDEDVLFCVGSLYLIGELKKIINRFS